MTTNHTFGQAIEALTQGKMISRAGWNGKGMFVFRQVPSEVPAAIIPKMTSLPELVKEKLAERGVPLRYENQMALVNADSTINGWVASSSDTLASENRVEIQSQLRIYFRRRQRAAPEILGSLRSQKYQSNIP